MAKRKFSLSNIVYSLIAASGVDLWSVWELTRDDSRVVLGNFTPGPAFYSLIVCVTTIYILAVLIFLCVRRRKRRLDELQAMVVNAIEGCYSRANYFHTGVLDSEEIIRFNHDLRNLEIDLGKGGIKFKPSPIENGKSPLQSIDENLSALLALDNTLRSEIR